MKLTAAAEWPFPIAQAQPSAASESSEVVSSAEARASTDGTFAMDLEHDEFLQGVSRNSNDGIDRGDRVFRSAKHAIVRGFLARADFADWSAG